MVFFVLGFIVGWLAGAFVAQMLPEEEEEE